MRCVVFDALCVVLCCVVLCCVVLCCVLFRICVLCLCVYVFVVCTVDDAALFGCNVLSLVV